MAVLAEDAQRYRHPEELDTFFLGVAALLSRGIGLLLFGVRPWDPAIVAGVVLTLVAAGLVASMIPARRAAHVDPVEALRFD